MSVGLSSIFNLAANAMLAVFGFALALLVIWHNSRVQLRSNLYFALCMAIFALNGLLGCPFQVAQIYDLDPKPLLKVLTTLYIAGIILLFNFILVFCGFERRWRWIERAISIPLGIAFIVLTWSGRLFTDFEVLDNGGYNYHLTTLGQAGVVVAGAYLAGILVVLYRQRNPKAREFFAPVVVLVIGILTFGISPAERFYSVNTLALTVAVIMLGRLVIKYQVFQPLAELNHKIEITNLELAEATRLKSQFLANMSHELRTPLNSILGYTELVTGGTYGGLNDVQLDRLAKVNRNGRRLLALINDVLDLSRIEAGRLELKLTQVAPTTLLDGVMDEFEPQAQAKKITLVRGYAALPLVHVDELRARQILWNLVSNAVKFTETGSVIASGYYDATRRLVVINITDTGPGIPQAQHPYIFEAFHQFDDTTFRRHEGTHMGLAISRELAQIQGGMLWCESTPGQGSTFHVALPVSESENPVNLALMPGGAASGPLVLAIDDDCEAVELLQTQLERAGFRVYGACTAKEGLRLAHELRPAVVTLDMRMPDMTGEQVLAALRRDPLTAAIPVLVVSATDDNQQAHAAGANAFVTKPVQPELLVSQVQRLSKMVVAPKK
ncbi:MAG: response regulator [Chloroflexi bacterium]|nr:response regulator [Chloroflexota bacterium]